MQGQVDRAMQEMVEKVREQEAESGDIEEEGDKQGKTPTQGQIEESRQRTDTTTDGERSREQECKERETDRIRETEKQTEGIKSLGHRYGERPREREKWR